mmetsp:Transcript_1439/g.2516  ORF Transcript_1439/g.2516 Transcript_1439/m.2516 type:complete len:131 (+) Transcript_1439:431-823(+)
MRVAVASVQEPEVYRSPPSALVKSIDSIKDEGISLAKKIIYQDIYQRELAKMVEPTKQAVRDYFKAKYGKEYKVGVLRRFGDMVLLPHAQPKPVDGIVNPQDYTRPKKLVNLLELEQSDMAANFDLVTPT